MPLATTIAKRVYTGNGTTTEFPFAYKFYATSDLVVNLYLISTGALTLQVESTDYTVVGGDDGDGGTTDYTSGGTVVMTAAPAATYKVIIERVLPLTQTFDFAPSGPFSEDSFEEELDRIVSILQQQQSIIDRCIKMDQSNTEISDAFDVDDITVEVDDFIISEFTAKTTVHANDLFVIADSEDSNNHKTVLQSKIININNETEKTALHANDLLYIEDSQASYVKKKVKSGNVLIINTLTAKTTPHADDLLVMEDSEASNAKKKIKQSLIKPVDLAIASQVAGDVLYFDGTNWIRLAKGAATQVLAMNSGATAPEWIDNTPGLTLISVTTISAVKFSSNIAISTGNVYKAIFIGSFDSGASVLRFEFNGDTSAYTYAAGGTDETGSAVGTGGGAAGNGISTMVGSAAAADRIMITMTISPTNNDSHGGFAMGQTMSINGDSDTETINWGGQWDDNSTVTSFRLHEPTNSQNFSGIVYLYKYTLS